MPVMADSPKTARLRCGNLLHGSRDVRPAISLGLLPSRLPLKQSQDVRVGADRNFALVRNRQYFRNDLSMHACPFLLGWLDWRI